MDSISTNRTDLAFPRTTTIFFVYIVVSILNWISDFYLMDLTDTWSLDVLTAYAFIKSDLLTALGLVFIFYCSKSHIKVFFSNRSVQVGYPIVVNWTVFLMCFSFASALILFIPLSYVFPDFVSYYFLYTIDFFPKDHEGQFSILASICMFITVVFAAPILEEIIFRGLLLRRWMEIFGRTKAVVLTSLLFGFLHPDPIGAFAFAVVMCLLYLHSASLWVCIVCHALNNFIFWSMEFFGAFIQSEKNLYDVKELQSDWPLALFFVVISLIWFALIMCSKHNPNVWKYRIKCPKNNIT